MALSEIERIRAGMTSAPDEDTEMGRIRASRNPTPSQPAITDEDLLISAALRGGATAGGTSEESVSDEFFGSGFMRMLNSLQGPSAENARKTPIESMQLREGWWNPATPAVPGAAPGAAPGAGAPRPTRQFMPMVSNLSAQDGRTVVGTSTPLAKALRSGQRR